VWVPFVTVPHLANSSCNKQFLFSPSIDIFKSSNSGGMISVKFPMSSFDVRIMWFSMLAVLFSSVMIVSDVSMFAASTIGISRSTTHSCFMLFHFRG